jgi:hypothetical protein
LEREYEQGQFHKQFLELRDEPGAQDDKIDELRVITNGLPTEEHSQEGLARAAAVRRLSIPKPFAIAACP